jgi:hypothetical protein
MAGMPMSRVPCPGYMLFELPRFGLEFELRAGLLWSLDYSGYHLHPRQQLLSEQGCLSPGACSIKTVYTLPNFRQYLVLQRAQQQSVMAGQRGGKRVIVPVGQVLRKMPEVAVVHGHCSSDHLEVRGLLYLPACYVVALAISSTRFGTHHQIHTLVMTLF